MTNKEIINQLENLKDHCQDWVDTEDEGNIWNKDVVALDRAIKVFQRKERSFDSIFMKILFALNFIIFFVSLVMLYGAIGSWQLDEITKQEFLFRGFTDVILICLSATSVISIWKGAWSE